MIEEISNQKITYVPNYISSSELYGQNFSVNSHVQDCRINPVYSDGNCCRFVINQNGFMDPYSFSLMFTVELDKTFNRLINQNQTKRNLLYQFDESAHSVIESLVLYCNGIEIERIDNYAYLNSILFDLTLPIEARQKLRQHGFGTVYKDDISIGTGEDFLMSEHDSGYKKHVANYFKYHQLGNLSDLNGGVMSDINKVSKTFVIPILSNILGLRINEYKFVPLYLFPNLEVEIKLNKYAMFSALNSAHQMNKQQDIELCQANFVKVMDIVRQYYNADHTYKELFLITRNIIRVLQTEETLSGPLSIIAYADMVHRNYDNRLNDVFNNSHKQRLIINLIYGNSEGNYLGIEDNRKLHVYFGNSIMAYLVSLNFPLQCERAVSEVNLWSNYLLAPTKAEREFKIREPKLLFTQILFETSYHYQMINRIKSFSLFYSSYDSTFKRIANHVYNNILVNDFEEYSIVNFPRQSITKFISAFYTMDYLRDSTIRQLSRYSLGVSFYSVRIGVNNYPKEPLMGNTNNTSVYEKNNLIFFNELYKSFEGGNNEIYHLPVRGIINPTNYSLAFQKNDNIANIGRLLLYNNYKKDFHGRNLICVSTSKLTKASGVFAGENNSSGNDIVRHMVCENNSSVVFGALSSFSELIIIEYDCIFNVTGIGQFNIIK